MGEGILEDHIIKIALDDLENKPLLDANKLNEYIRFKIKDTEQYYLFLDEIQEVDDFVPLLNSLLKIDYFE